ncbi:MAG: DNA-binding protein [Bacteroidaceae bacterium]|nr:DNA-binding protein [Bacteroidaceae bacterium]
MINYSIAIMSAHPGTKKQDIQETKAYGTAQMKEKLSFSAFCKHLADHNSPFSKGAIMDILIDAVSCLREMMLAGNRVSFGDLGDFGVELACEGARTCDEFSAANIKAVNVRWSPGKSFENLRDDATFQLVPSRAAQADAIEVIKNEDTIQGLESHPYNPNGD